MYIHRFEDARALVVCPQEVLGTTKRVIRSHGAVLESIVPSSRGWVLRLEGCNEELMFDLEHLH